MQERSTKEYMVPELSEGSLFIVSASKETASLVGKALTGLGFRQPVYPFQPTTGLIMALDTGHVPSLFLLDYRENKAAIKSMVVVLKNNPLYRRIPLIMMIDPDDKVAASDAYKMGANATMAHPDFRDSFYQSIFSTISFWFKTAQLPKNKE